MFQPLRTRRQGAVLSTLAARLWRPAPAQGALQPPQMPELRQDTAQGKRRRRGGAASKWPCVAFVSSRGGAVLSTLAARLWRPALAGGLPKLKDLPSRGGIARAQAQPWGGEGGRAHASLPCCYSCPITGNWKMGPGNYWLNPKP